MLQHGRPDRSGVSETKDEKHKGFIIVVIIHASDFSLPVSCVCVCVCVLCDLNPGFFACRPPISAGSNAIPCCTACLAAVEGHSTNTRLSHSSWILPFIPNTSVKERIIQKAKAKVNIPARNL